MATVAVFFRPGAKADARVRPWLELGPRPPAGRGPAVPCQIPPLGPARVAQRPLLVAVPALLSSHSKKERKKISRLRTRRPLCAVTQQACAVPDGGSRGARSKEQKWTRQESLSRAPSFFLNYFLYKYYFIQYKNINGLSNSGWFSNDDVCSWSRKEKL